MLIRGYCSNSPSRCERAKDLILIISHNDCCPDCGSALVLDFEDEGDGRLEQRMFQVGLMCVLLVSLQAIYLTYLM